MIPTGFEMADLHYSCISPPPFSRPLSLGAVLIKEGDRFYRGARRRWSGADRRRENDGRTAKDEWHYSKPTAIAIKIYRVAHDSVIRFITHSLNISPRISISALYPQKSIF